MLYFRGCTTKKKLENIFNSTEKLLKIANVDYEILDDENCCGSILLRIGNDEEAKKLIKNNIATFKNEKILVSCAGCYMTFKEDYKKLFNVNLDVLHSSQLFKKLIDENKLNINASDINVTYHDPCHLTRHSYELDAPRELIKSIANLKEMENNRENSKCCGAGGGVKSAFPDIAKSIAKSRLKEVEDTKCETVITTCPFCKLNLDENSSLEVLDLSEFILKNLV
ncbi:MAG: (Fe-S)-binding protein [Methanobacteriaceae archaeon]|jgi:Fe-S oxidoreductase|nr:(Fe-S)-binding protein [Candidatus Methanorudis spinitermitis]